MLSAAFSLWDMWASNKGLFACLVAFELIFAEIFGSINLANIGGFHLFLPSIFGGLVSMRSGGYAEWSSEIFSSASWWLHEGEAPAPKVSIYLPLQGLNMHRLLTSLKHISFLPLPNTDGYAGRKSILLKQTYLYQKR